MALVAVVAAVALGACDGGDAHRGASTTFTVPPGTGAPGSTTPPPGRMERPAPAEPAPVDAAGFSQGHTLLGLPLAQLRVDLDGMAATGARWLRMDFDWSYVQRVGPGSYDWSSIDVVVREAQARGLEVLALLAFTPEWARPAGAPDKHPPLDPDRFAVYASEAAKRYAPLGVHTWEIWNEPNVSDFWAPRPDPEGYAALLERAAAAIRAVDSSATVVSGGLAPATDRSDGTQIRDRTFLARLYDAGAGGSFDAVGLHAYSFPALPTEPLDWSSFATAPLLHTVMAEHGDGAKKVWVTEMGAPTGGARRMTEEGQAETVRLAYDAWTKQAFAGPLIWFSWRDEGPDRTDQAQTFGLVRNDGSAKPALTAFVEEMQALRRAASGRTAASGGG